MAEDKKSAEIRRMACHKVAIEAVGPVPAKGISEAWKQKFLEVTDFLDQDVKNAYPVLDGEVVAQIGEGATMASPTNGGTPITLDESIELTDWLREIAVDNRPLQNQIKLTLVSLGANGKSLEESVSKLTREQVSELRTKLEGMIN